MKSTVKLLSVSLAAAAMVASAGVAVAQQDGYDQLAPGFGGPDQYVDFGEREVLDGYGLVEGDLPDTNLVDSGDGALTEFAGQKRKYNPGVIGGVLGGVKRAIIGSDD